MVMELWPKDDHAINVTLNDALHYYPTKLRRLVSWPFHIRTELQMLHQTTNLRLHAHTGSVVSLFLEVCLRYGIESKAWTSLPIYETAGPRLIARRFRKRELQVFEKAQLEVCDR